MKETGIIMSGDHPKLILDGIKTMTRRTAGLDEVNKQPDQWEVQPTMNPSVWAFLLREGKGSYLDRINIKCPYGQVGDRLIIKETWATENRYNHLKPSEIPRTATIFYLASIDYNPFTMGKVRSARFMCHWMSRAKPEITEVRVERVQEISEDGCYKEGIELPHKRYEGVDRATRLLFQYLWDSLNAKRGFGWESNPWVWVISYETKST